MPESAEEAVAKGETMGIQDHGPSQRQAWATIAGGVCPGTLGQGGPPKWIVKPNGLSKGRGILLVRDRAELVRSLREQGSSTQGDDSSNLLFSCKSQGRLAITSSAAKGADAPRIKQSEADCRENTDGSDQKHQNYVVQRYVTPPMLIEGRKFDLRVYALVARVSPLLAFYHDGYVRLALHPYHRAASDDRFAHLTNLSIQKLHPSFVQRRERQVLGFDKLRRILSSRGNRSPTAETSQIGLQMDDITADDPSDGGESHEDVLEENVKPQIKKALKWALRLARGRLDTRGGQFCLLGADLILDSFGRVYLLEFNKNPDLELHTRELEKLLPGMVNEALDIALEANRSGRVSCVEGFEYLYDEAVEDFRGGPTPSEASAIVLESEHED